ncbi:flagellar hook-length control protein FliK [Thiomicrospira sp. XS5]|uniref:flagellar hook-length control protein FliK n=1 Tax=Thiomicrospira sp. XS5 TaxID=1775636 RepID=UPI000838C40C|nr:flagellar hook-length control protein FliK [Thiomicrospira sp. XS5]
MIEQNPVLKALNTSGQPHTGTESVGERQLLPKLKGAFAEVLNKASEASDEASKEAFKLGQSALSDIQIDADGMARNEGLMVASLATGEKGLPQTALSGGQTETDLDMVMKQIHLPQEKLPTLPSEAMKAVSSVNAMLDSSGVEESTESSEKPPGLVELSLGLAAEEEGAETLLDQEPVAAGVTQPIVSETLSDTVDSELTASAAADMNAPLEQPQDSLPKELAQTASAESMVDVTDTVSQTTSDEKLTGLAQAQERVSENVPDEAKAPEVLASLQASEETGTEDVAPLGDTKTSVEASREPSGPQGVRTDSQNTVPGTPSSANVTAQAQTSESNMKDAAQEKERPSLNAQAHTNQPKADGALGKEMSDGKSHKSDAGVSTSAQQNAASSQSNQQGQQSFSGQQQAQQQFMNQVQKQVVQSQQEAVKTANEASSVESEKAEKAEKLLGNLGLGLDAKKTMSQSLSIPHPVRSPQWGQALGQKVTYMANNKLQEAKITLNPEKLGPIQVKLSMDKDHQAHVSMVAQHGTTRDAIENAMPRLREMLESAGIGFGSFDVRDESGSSEQRLANQDGQSSSGQSSGHLLTDGDEAETAGDGMVQTVSSDNLVDFYA